MKKLLYQFDTDALPSVFDKVDGFNALDDVFRLDGSVFTGLQSGPLAPAYFVAGTRAVDDSDHIIYDRATGDLLFDADGAGGAAALKFAAVDRGISLSADDFIVA